MPSNATTKRSPRGRKRRPCCACFGACSTPTTRFSPKTGTMCAPHGPYPRLGALLRSAGLARVVRGSAREGSQREVRRYARAAGVDLGTGQPLPIGRAGRVRRGDVPRRRRDPRGPADHRERPQARSRRVPLSGAQGRARGPSFRPARRLDPESGRRLGETGRRRSGQAGRVIVALHDPGPVAAAAREISGCARHRAGRRQICGPAISDQKSISCRRRSAGRARRRWRCY